MNVFYFTEQPYPDAWNPEATSLRVTLPNSECDPSVMADLYARYFDEWMLADELGFDLMVNEHHATATCLSSVAGVTLSILARQTKRARLLTLGYPIANRLDPVRIAEELAMIDVISRGRLEMGFVRGVPYELGVTQKSAVGMTDRFWEAHDLILKALSTRDGPFNWQGKHFQARNVNVWPRPYQDPHPPVWISGRSRSNIRDIASRGHVFATFLSGKQTAGMFDYYREVAAELGHATPSADRFAYLGIVAVADTHDKAMQRARILVNYLRTSALVAEPFDNPPGYMSAADSARMMRANGKRTAKSASGKAVDVHSGSIEELIDAGAMFVGTPDEVYEQIAAFDDDVGGLGNLLMMGHAASLSHADTVNNLTLFAKEVLPRLKQRSASRITVSRELEQAGT
ncbi:MULTISPECIES: LLM class flavin-dependent oxidoreductase [unclassified Caballeronia]|uniref:LLM class flavin-dependent oxidoreductase n=1 Tax=unclassified Caballeronia TaxID=2646786 RepID=UPI002027B356|nr:MULTISPECIES: LLM class flavin-dependent oxidoreductase [unclassified Caballeronia]